MIMVILKLFQHFPPCVTLGVEIEHWNNVATLCKYMLKMESEMDYVYISELNNIYST